MRQELWAGQENRVSESLTRVFWKKSEKMILSLSVSKGSDIVPDTSQIQGLSVLKNLFPVITVDSNSKISLCPERIRYPSRLQVWMGFIH